jgi:hypothetical protein
MVNCLLTVSIKVNIPASAESNSTQGMTMKKMIQARWSFWQWVLGGGSSSGGSGG